VFLTGRLHGLVASANRHELPPETKTVEEALNGPHAEQWKEAIQKEYDALVERNTWELQELPPGRRAIGVKWVLKIKTTATGELEKFKARLVAKGYSQVKGIDYNDTYAPVSRFTTFRTLMSLTAIDRLYVIQLDVKNAFLYGDLEETELYMQQPPGYHDGTSRACKLIKSLYGLKQAPLVWYDNIEQYLLANGWTVCDSDWALFRTGDGATSCWLLLYVDDILIFSSCKEAAATAKELLVSKYHLNVENLTKYLGINVDIHPNGGTVRLALQRYAGTIGNKYPLAIARRELNVPLTHDPNAEDNYESTLQVVPQNEIPSKDQIKDYQSKVGSLMFAASTTRPDLQLACSKLAQGNKKPTLLHRDQVQRALRYFLDTSSLSLVYSGEVPNPSVLVGYSDANYSRTGPSQSGFVFLLGGSAISWGSKKQSCVVLSSTEAELVAAVTCGQEAVYLRRLLKELGHTQNEPTVIFIDNSAVLDLTKTEKRLGNSKHFNRLSWLRHLVDEKIIELRLIRSEHQTADFLTKVLAKGPFTQCRNRVGLQS
jgi:hypothetical protein